jgi:hypothetical protein
MRKCCFTPSIPVAPNLLHYFVPGPLGGLNGPFLVQEGKRSGFGQMGTVVLWEVLDDPEFTRLKILLTDNWGFVNAQELSARRVDR